MESPSLCASSPRSLLDTESEESSRAGEKMEENCGDPVPKRASLKSQSHFNTYPIWKNKLRENCYRRVREDRSRLIWKMRSSTSQSLDHKDMVKSVFHDIVSDELKKFKTSSNDDSMGTSTTALEANDMLWEYDGLQEAYQGECEEILLEMQKIFYEDLTEEPTRISETEPASHIEIWLDEEDEYLARAVYDHMQLNDDQVHKKTWCPICKHGELRENCHLINCSLCEFQLNKGDEINLDKLRARLADAHAEHLDRGCRLKPKFCIQSRFGLTALYISCQGCATFEVVV